MIEGIKKDNLLGFFAAAVGRGLAAARSMYSLKIIVEHSRMTNQTHTLGLLCGIGSHDLTTPGTSYFKLIHIELEQSCVLPVF